MIKLFISTVAIFFSFQSAYSQINISGKIIDSDNQPIEYVSAEIFQNDSLKHQTFTDKNDFFFF